MAEQRPIGEGGDFLPHAADPTIEERYKDQLDAAGEFHRKTLGEGVIEHGVPVGAFKTGTEIVRSTVKVDVDSTLPEDAEDARNAVAVGHVADMQAISRAWEETHQGQAPGQDIGNLDKLVKQ